MKDFYFIHSNLFIFKIYMSAKIIFFIQNMILMFDLAHFFHFHFLIAMNFSSPINARLIGLFLLISDKVNEFVICYLDYFHRIPIENHAIFKIILVVLRF
jgi:hypothetical protein